jgi:hypothetical protein
LQDSATDVESLQYDGVPLHARVEHVRYYPNPIS